jgi:hypothetical protein
MALSAFRRRRRRCYEVRLWLLEIPQCLELAKHSSITHFAEGISASPTAQKHEKEMFPLGMGNSERQKISAILAPVFTPGRQMLRW